MNVKQHSPQDTNRIARDMRARCYQNQAAFDGLANQQVVWLSSHPQKRTSIEQQFYFSGFHLGQQLGKMGFCFMNIDYLRHDRLQNMTNLKGH